MDLATLLQGSAPAPKPYSKTYGKRSRDEPLSPPVEEPKCSLPSISTLLENADGHAAKRQRLSPVSRTSDAHSVRLPPTPPLRPGSGSGRHSHSPIEAGSKPSESSHPHRSATSTVTSGPYASPAPSVSSYSSPVDAPQTHGTLTTPLFYTRPPTAGSFAPGPAPPMPQHQHQHQHQHQPQKQQHQQQSPPAGPPSTQSPSLISPVTPAWQHHHYFPPSTSTTYQQTHDRYICRTCHKAFSRPSSLRIHSHSHTGEKPFRCTHAGCGKAFSVRSNMKRHERGCHSGRPAVPATALVS